MVFRPPRLCVWSGLCRHGRGHSHPRSLYPMADRELGVGCRSRSCRRDGIRRVFAPISAASGTTVIVTPQVAHVVDIGYSGLFAATVFGLMGLTSSLGRMVF